MSGEAAPIGPLFLVGFMGAGKSRIGRLLARKLDCPFLDTDLEIERRRGKRIPEIFAEDGEAVFRGEETRCIAELLAGTRQVVSTGGGMFLRHANRKMLLDGGRVVWLDVPLVEIRKRLDRSPIERPLWPQDDMLAQRVLWARRRASYALAHHRIVVQAAHPGMIVQRIVEAIGQDAAR